MLHKMKQNEDSFERIKKEKNEDVCSGCGNFLVNLTNQNVKSNGIRTRTGICTRTKIQN